jgi:hypothetical protein
MLVTKPVTITSTQDDIHHAQNPAKPRIMNNKFDSFTHPHPNVPLSYLGPLIKSPRTCPYPAAVGLDMCLDSGADDDLAPNSAHPIVHRTKEKDRDL